MGVKSTIGRRIESWDTAGRPVSPNAGRHGYNTELARFETWDSNESDWVAAGANISRPFLKTGQTDATNADSILPSDNILHPAKTNLGANEATQPFESQYAQKFYGNTKVTGKMLHTEYAIDNITTVSIAINPTTGSDILDDTAYPSATFQTLTKAFDWIEKCKASRFNISVSGTSSGTPSVLGTARSMHNKVLIFASGHYAFNATMTCINCHVQFNTGDLYLNIASSISVINCCLYLSNGTLTNNAGASSNAVINLINRSELLIKASWTCTFTQNNQNLLGLGSSTSFKAVLLAIGTVQFITTGVTGCNFVQTSTNLNPCVLSMPANGAIGLLVNGISLQNITIERAFEGFSLGGFSNNDYGKNLALYNLKAIYTPNQQSFENRAAAFAGLLINGEHYVDNLGYQKVMTSNPNDVKSWTSAGRPASPYLGMDGFNTTDSVREYWDGTNWIQY